MNQILQTKLNNKNKKFKKVLKIQLFFSVILIILISVYTLYNKITLYNEEKYSKHILDNYNITKLYSNLFSDENTQSTETLEGSSVIGIIQIDKINIKYPIFSNYDDTQLKVSPCRFYGPLPGEIGNLCIAGHNYDNDKFFSKISSLNINDEIVIINNSNKKFSYYVYDIYEVKSDNLSPIYDYDDNSIQLTLITCNNLNNNRIIVRAIYKR